VIYASEGSHFFPEFLIGLNFTSINLCFIVRICFTSFIFVIYLIILSIRVCSVYSDGNCTTCYYIIIHIHVVLELYPAIIYTIDSYINPKHILNIWQGKNGVKTSHYHVKNNSEDVISRFWCISTRNVNLCMRFQLSHACMYTCIFAYF
jgi:hypothetical protein